MRAKKRIDGVEEEHGKDVGQRIEAEGHGRRDPQVLRQQNAGGNAGANRRPEQREHQPSRAARKLCRRLQEARCARVSGEGGGIEDGRRTENVEWAHRCAVGAFPFGAPSTTGRGGTSDRCGPHAPFDSRGWPIGGGRWRRPLIDLHCWRLAGEIAILLRWGCPIASSPAALGGATSSPRPSWIQSDNRMPAIVDHAPADGAGRSPRESGAIMLTSPADFTRRACARGTRSTSG